IKFNEECNRIVSKFTFGFDSFWKSRMDICKEYFERNQNLLDKYFQIIYDEVHKIGPLDVKENIEVCGLFGLGVNSRSGYDYIFLKEGHINCDINKFLQLIVHEYAGHSYHEENSNMEKVFGKFSYIADEGLAKVVSDKIVSLIPGIETIRCHNHDEPIEISYQVYENNWQKLDKGQSFEEWHKDCLLEIKEIYDSKEIDYFIYRGK
ncbi:hypothetical protein KY334_03550, partial [Candidatus Woesearchaeota archaeon]|nr:hypothetical protein [Candidatus Woesearchaeota archaeon]